MATVSSLGVGSGLDLNSILTQMMEIQRQPLYDLQSRQQAIQTQISDYGSLKSAVSTFQDAMDALTESDAFQLFQTSSSDESVFTATAESGAAAGNYDISVTQLAKAHKLASMRYADSDTATVGTGTLEITVGSDTMSLTVDSSNNTLEGLRDAINNASDNPGITATIINEGGGSRLMLSADESGTANAMTITNQSTVLGGMFDTTNDLDGDDGNNVAGQAELVSAAQDATFTIDSFSVTSSTNEVSDVIQGVTFNLMSEGDSTLSISRDNDAVTELAQNFVDAYNTLKDKMDSLRNGNLKGDYAVTQLERTISNQLSQAATIDSASHYLFEVGISRTQTGKLELDTEEFTSALESSTSFVASLFAEEDQGFAFRLSQAADTLLDETNGLFATREDSLNNRLDMLEESQARLERRLEDIEARYVKQFSALDTTMAQLTSTSNYLSSQLLSLMG